MEARERGQAWLLLVAPDSIPERFRERSVQAALLRLDPHEATVVMEGGQNSNESDRLLHLVAEGGSPDEIARQLNVSVRSVYRRLAGLRRAYDVRTNHELAAVLARQGF